MLLGLLSRNFSILQLTAVVFSSSFILLGFLHYQALMTIDRLSKKIILLEDLTNRLQNKLQLQEAVPSVSPESSYSLYLVGGGVVLLGCVVILIWFYNPGFGGGPNSGDITPVVNRAPQIQSRDVWGSSNTNITRADHERFIRPLEPERSLNDAIKSIDTVDLNIPVPVPNAHPVNRILNDTSSSLYSYESLPSSEENVSTMGTIVENFVDVEPAAIFVISDPSFIYASGQNNAAIALFRHNFTEALQAAQSASGALV
jgi:hypothetical protein